MTAAQRRLKAWAKMSSKQKLADMDAEDQRRKIPVWARFYKDELIEAAEIKPDARIMRFNGERAVCGVLIVPDKRRRK
jgi:hypothetical protein